MCGIGKGNKRVTWLALLGYLSGIPLVAGGCEPARSAPEHVASPSSPRTSAGAPGDSLATAVSGTSPATPAPPRRQAQHLVNYRFESPTLGPVPVVVRVPEFQLGQVLPALILLHGRGESQKAPERGARGYLDDYAIEAAWKWLAAPDESAAPKDLPPAFTNQVRQRLEAARFAGMVLVFPYLPDRFRGPEAFVNAGEYSRVLGQVMTRIQAELPVRQDAGGWALDGISLGGRVALLCGSHLAERIGATGSVQAAIDERELSLFADALAEARRRNPALHHTLATSEHDYFRVVLEHYHAQLLSRGSPHDWVVLPGDHSYAFNRGPGVVHLLTTYDRWFAPVNSRL